MERLEFVHGFSGVGGAARSRRVLETFTESVAATVRSFFICTRSDLLCGNIGRILDIPAFQAVFVDRIVLANILASAITISGEDLLPHVPVKPIRRVDVFKAWFGLFGQVLLSAAFFPLTPSATEYAAAALKRSVHNCFFVYELRRASLEEEVSFFQRRLGSSRTLTELLALRREHQRSLAFVIQCLPTLVRLHTRTALDNTFPRRLVKAR